ncbi:hypothetical protein OIU91_17110 [Streptomyces sp. NBC_01456]|uniref:hypothetical protein n=1 Tax=Streptomyces sp. NBC_01456 TaxID=2975868 RepID=UPI002E2EF05A|nr:hypothetical protein [Streptomyces sp. NBC_01456]
MAQESSQDQGPVGYTTGVQDEDVERDWFWENVALGLLGLMPLFIAEQRQKSDDELAALAERAEYTIAHKADAFQFQKPGGKPTGVLSALAAGMAALARQPGGVTALGVHACTRTHEGCPK